MTASACLNDANKADIVVQGCAAWAANRVYSEGSSRQAFRYLTSSSQATGDLSLHKHIACLPVVECCCCMPTQTAEVQVLCLMSSFVRGTTVHTTKLFHERSALQSSHATIDPPQTALICLHDAGWRMSVG